MQIAKLSSRFEFLLSGLQTMGQILLLVSNKGKILMETTTLTKKTFKKKTFKYLLRLLWIEYMEAKLVNSSIFAKIKVLHVLRLKLQKKIL